MPLKDYLDPQPQPPRPSSAGIGRFLSAPQEPSAPQRPSSSVVSLREPTLPTVEELRAPLEVAPRELIRRTQAGPQAPPAPTLEQTRRAATASITAGEVFHATPPVSLEQVPARLAEAQRPTFADLAGLRDHPVLQAVTATGLAAAHGFLAPVEGMLQTKLPGLEEVAPDLPGSVRTAAGIVGGTAGFAANPLGVGAFRIAGAVVPKTIAPFVAQMLQQFGVGATYEAIDTIVTHQQELAQMPPAQAALTVAERAGMGGAAWAVTGAALEGLVRGTVFAGTGMVTAARTIKDALSRSGSTPTIEAMTDIPVPAATSRFLERLRETERPPAASPEPTAPLPVHGPTEAVPTATTGPALTPTAETRATAAPGPISGQPALPPTPTVPEGMGESPLTARRADVVSDPELRVEAERLLRATGGNVSEALQTWGERRVTAAGHEVTSEQIEPHIRQAAERMESEARAALAPRAAAAEPSPAAAVPGTSPQVGSFEATQNAELTKTNDPFSANVKALAAATGDPWQKTRELWDFPGLFETGRPQTLDETVSRMRSALRYGVEKEERGFDPRRPSREFFESYGHHAIRPDDAAEGRAIEEVIRQNTSIRKGTKAWEQAEKVWGPVGVRQYLEGVIRRSEDNLRLLEKFSPKRVPEAHIWEERARALAVITGESEETRAAAAFGAKVRAAEQNIVESFQARIRDNQDVIEKAQQRIAQLGEAGPQIPLTPVAQSKLLASGSVRRAFSVSDTMVRGNGWWGDGSLILKGTSPAEVAEKTFVERDAARVVSDAEKSATKPVQLIAVDDAKMGGSMPTVAGWVGEGKARQPIFLNGEYVALVRKTFGDVVWTGSGREKPLIARKGGHIVAVMAPVRMREDSPVYQSAMRLLEGKSPTAQEPKPEPTLAGAQGDVTLSSVVFPGAQKVGDIISKAAEQAKAVFHSAFPPRPAPGTPAHELEQRVNALLGEHDVFSWKSQVFWQRHVTPDLQRFVRARPGVTRKTEAQELESLKGALGLYIDSMRAPDPVKQKLPEALAAWPDFQRYVDRMHALTDAEKAYAEQVLIPYDRLRGQYRIDHEIMSQVIDFHVSHLWEVPEQKAGAAAPVSLGARLSPSSRFSRQRTIPTFVDGIAAGLRPRTLDIVAINQMNDLDTARAVMASGIREALLETGVAKWSTSREQVPEDWVDLGAHMRIFRKSFPMGRMIAPKGPAAEAFSRGVSAPLEEQMRRGRFAQSPFLTDPNAQIPEIVSKQLGQGVTVYRGEPEIGETRLYVAPEAERGIRFLYERDPFKEPYGGAKARGASGLADLLFRYNSYVKLMELSYSLFHDANLSRVFGFSRLLTALKGATVGVDLQAPGIYEKWGPVSEGIGLITSLEPTLERLVRGGLTLDKSNVMDVYYLLAGGEKKWGLDNAFVRARTRALWQTLQPSLKATDAVMTVRDALKKFGPDAQTWTGKPVINPRTQKPFTEEEIFEGVARVLNDKYGGLNFDRLRVTMGQRRLLRAAILAPDWTLSNIRLGLAAVSGEKRGLVGGAILGGAAGGAIAGPPGAAVGSAVGGLGIGALTANTPEAWAARQSLAKTVAVFFATLQGANMLMNNGKTTLQNDGGRWWSLQLPWKAQDGRTLFADWLVPGELKDLMKIAGSLTGLGTGLATDEPGSGQHVSNLLGFVQGKLSPIAGSSLQLLTKTDFAGRRLIDPGMTSREAATAVGVPFLEKFLPIPIGLTSAIEYARGKSDVTQLAAQVTGIGPTSRGALVPASAWQSLPRFNKAEFLHKHLVTAEQRDDFVRQLQTGRITGDVAERFRRYVERYRYFAQRRAHERPVDQRYLPPHHHRREEAPISVAP